MPEEAVLERIALREWRAGLSASYEIPALEAFLAKYQRARIVAEVASQRLLLAKARAAAAGDTERERVFKLFEAMEGGSDPDTFAFFLSKHFAQYPELAMPAAQRRQELDPDAFLAFARATPGAGERLADVIDHAQRLIRLRDTKPEAAILRLDPGMHTAVIGRIGVSADGRLLATGSDDKTVKLWALPDRAEGTAAPARARLVRTFRLPIGEGDEGKVYAVALDPAGGWVAAGGWDKGASPQNSALFVILFDCTTGRLLARLGPLSDVVNDLAVSPDGARLAAGVGGANGIAVWDVPTVLAGAPGSGPVAPLFADPEFGGAVYGLAFGPAGTAAAGALAATSYDGQVRLYAPDGALYRLAARLNAPSGSQPHGVAFSPDGRRLAVGYEDALAVDLLDTATLTPLGAADVSGLSGGNLASVAFVPAPNVGAAILAAGGFHTDRDRPIFIWPNAGSGLRQRWPGPDNTVMDLEPMARSATGALAFGAFDPVFGMIGPDGTKSIWQGPATADLRGKRREHFTVSADGKRLRFGLKPGSAAPVLFDLAARRLVDAPQPAPGLAEADTRRLAIQGWENTRSVTLTRQRFLRTPVATPLPLRQYEIARSLAIAPDGQTFVLGTEWRLRRFDAAGKQLWERQVPGVVWGVNLARKGALILAAYSDGTIRWHRASDGQELLALFIHLPEGPDGPREWILFTPDGYYDASSPAAEQLIGWHVNRGPDEAADFYPVETFASTFKRPDRINAALSI
jgi:WD40 repeat protein